MSWRAFTIQNSCVITKSARKVSKTSPIDCFLTQAHMHLKFKLQEIHNSLYDIHTGTSAHIL